jgi:cytochrome c oxidase subunit 2
MFKTRLARALGVVIGAGVLLRPASAQADLALNMTRGVTPVSRQAYDLHMLVLWICVAVGLAVFGLLLYSIFRHRKSRGAVAAQFHESTAVEVVWTAIPFAILVAIAVPATRALVALEDNRDSDLTVKVTGYQWKWKYEYLDSGVTFFSSLAASSRDAVKGDPSRVEHYLLDVDNPVVLPTHKKVRFVVTSNDVIHSWWVPALGFKQDAIPGFINEAWTYIDEPGIYRGQCAELCGKDHAFMPIVVVAKSEQEYRSWLAQMQASATTEAQSAGRQWSMAELMERGEKVYAAACAACHQPNGQGIPGAFPALAGSKIATGPLAGHLHIVLNGKPGTAMQAFKAQLSDAEIAAVVTYERNAFGNSAGDMVQPSAVAGLR